MSIGAHGRPITRMNCGPIHGSRKFEDEAEKLAIQEFASWFGADWADIAEEMGYNVASSVQTEITNLIAGVKLRKEIRKDHGFEEDEDLGGGRARNFDAPVRATGKTIGGQTGRA